METFKGRRRKLGVVLLVPAGFCMAAWLRSYLSADDVITIASNYQLYSHNGSISWNIISPHPLAFDLAYPLVGDDGKGIEITNQLVLAGGPSQSGLRIWTSPSIQWQREFCGFLACEISTFCRRTVQYWVPYWSFTTPLAILSAYLILWTPRTKLNSSKCENFLAD